MSKFNDNNKKIDNKTPIGTKLLRIEDPWECLDVGTVCYLYKVKKYENTEYGYTIDVKLLGGEIDYDLSSNYFKIID